MPSIKLSNDETLQLRKFLWAINFARRADAGNFSNDDHYAEMSEYLFRSPGTIENFLLLGDTRTKFQYGIFLAVITEFGNRPSIEKNTQVEFAKWCESIQNKFTKIEDFVGEEASYATQDDQSTLSKQDTTEVMQLFQGSNWFLYTKGLRGQIEVLFKSVVYFGSINDDNSLNVQMKHPRFYPGLPDHLHQYRELINYIATATSIDGGLEINIHELEIVDNGYKIKTLPYFSYRFENSFLQDASLAIGTVFYQSAKLNFPFPLSSLMIRVQNDVEIIPEEVDLFDNSLDKNVRSYFKYGFYTEHQTRYKRPYNLDTLNESTNAARAYRRLAMPELEGDYVLITGTNFKDIALPKLTIFRKPEEDPKDYLLTASLQFLHLRSKCVLRGRARPNFKSQLITFILYEQYIDEYESDFDKQPMILMIQLPERRTIQTSLLSGTLVGSKIHPGSISSKMLEGKESCAELIFLKKVNVDQNFPISTEETKALQDFYTKFKFQIRVVLPSKTISEFDDLKFL